MNIADDSYHIEEIEVDPSWIRDLGDDYREYRKKWDMASHLHLFDFPLFLEVETSYACNYRCPQCPRQAINHTKKNGFLSNDLLDKLFDEVKRYRLPSITFSHGGEPLMRKDIPELIIKARNAGVLDRMFHTNGSLLSKELSVRLIDAGLTKINFSLDAASAGVYAKVRSSGDYDRVLQNINDFLEARKQAGKSYPRVRVSFIVSELNKHEREDFYNQWKDLVNVISFQKCYDFTVTAKETLAGHETKKSYKCSQLWQLLTITYEGDMLVCEHDYNHEYVLGNLRTHSIHECWHSDTMKRFRDLHASGRWHDIPLCRNCVNSVQPG
ncbi:MAG: radical SAM protein [Nitrospirae bacterium]|nr:radical SAM protein [Nitrospirota bacterium]